VSLFVGCIVSDRSVTPNILAISPATNNLLSGDDNEAAKISIAYIFKTKIYIYEGKILEESGKPRVHG
jgi:hypothetical protein